MKCRYTEEVLNHFVYDRYEGPQNGKEKKKRHPAWVAAGLALFSLSVIIVRLSYAGIEWFDWIYFSFFILLTAVGLVGVRQINSLAIQQIGYSLLILLSLLLNLSLYELFRVILPYYQVMEWGYLVLLLLCIEIICTVALVRYRLIYDWYRQKRSGGRISGSIFGVVLAATFGTYFMHLARSGGTDSLMGISCLLAILLLLLCTPCATVCFAKLYYYYRYLRTSETSEK
ncbi:MAG: hypothetical protein ACI3XR_05910 [Eubacteriales bacterium]